MIYDKEKASANKLWMLNVSDILYFINDIRQTKKGHNLMYRSCSLYVIIIKFYFYTPYFIFLNVHE